MELWRLRSPKFAFNKLETQEGGDVIPFQSKSEGLSTEKVNGSSPSLNQKAGEEQCPSLRIVRQRYKILSYSAFCSIFSGLDEVHPQ